MFRGNLAAGASMIVLTALAMGPVTASAATMEDVLKRLEVMEKENSALRQRVKRLEGSPGDSARRGPPNREYQPNNVADARGDGSQMPVKGVRHVGVCDMYGNGYFIIPGSGFCLKVGGYIRGQVETNAGNGGIVIGTGPEAQQGRFTRDLTNDINYRVRAAASMDLVRDTRFGPMRAFFRGGVETTTPPDSGASRAATAWYDRAYFQFAGFTVGKARSAFDLFSQNNTMSYQNIRTSGDTDLIGVVMAAYTFRFGGAFAATVSLEDPAGHFKAGTVDTTCADFLGTGFVLQDNAFALNGAPCSAAPTGFGFRVPDVVANLRYEQPWGFVGGSFAVHDVSGAYLLTPNDVRHGEPADKLGWAASLGFQANTPGTQRDTFGANFVVSQGAVGYATSGQTWQLYNGNNSVGRGWAADGVFSATSRDTFIPPFTSVIGPADGTQIELTRAWSINAGYQHVWSDEWKTSLYGGYVNVSYTPEATALINDRMPAGSACKPAGGPAATLASFTPLAGNNCSPDFSFYQIGTRTQYNPVPWLDLGVELVYTHLNTAYKGPANFVSNGSRPACVNNNPAGNACGFDDQNVFSALARAQIRFND